MAILTPSEKDIYFPGATATDTDELTGLCILAQGWAQSQYGAGRLLEETQYIERIPGSSGLLQYWPVVTLTEIVARSGVTDAWQTLGATDYIRDDFMTGTRIYAYHNWLELRVTYTAGWDFTPPATDLDVQVMKAVTGSVLIQLERRGILATATQSDSADTQQDYDRLDRIMPQLLFPIRRYAPNG